MKKLIYFLAVLFSFTPYIQAQNKAVLANNGVLKGQIVDATKQAIAYASISILNENGELLQGAISDEQGVFELDKIPFANVSVEIQFLGFEAIKRNILFSKKNRKVDLGQVVMTEDQQLLEEVVVRAEKSQYSIRLDKKIFNVGKDVLSQGGSAIDILDQVPLVSVDPNGAVALRGNSQVQILINGRRSGLTSNNALDQIASENIERVEVITNPAASFEASGSAGIINIILKKNKKQGFNGQVRASAGIPADYVIVPSAHYKNKKINLFTNLRWRYSDYNGTYRTDQETIENGQSSFLNQTEDEDRHDDGRSGYFGGDYYFNDQNSFTAAYFRAETKDTDFTLLNYDLKNDAQANNIVREGNSVENRNYNQLEANYTHTYKEEGRKFTVDFQYDFWNSNKDWNLLTKGDLLPENIGRELRTSSISGSRDYVLKTDYVKPLKNSGILEIGLKGENRIVKNDYLAETFSNDQWTTYNQIDNKINYSEKIGAAYIQYKGKIKKLEYLLGLRSEYTLVDINDEENIFTDTQEYLNLFPTLHLSYPLSEKNSIQWSYSRRINRPSIWSLYPFSEIVDFNLQEIGNPNLVPSFTNGLEVSFLSIQEKLTVNPTLYYRHTNNSFQQFLSQNEQNTFIIQPINIDQKEEFGFEVSTKYQPAKVLSLNAEFNFFHFQENGAFSDVDFAASGNTWSLRLVSNMTLLKNIKFQTKFDYRAPRNGAQTKVLAFYTLSFGLNKDLLEKKLNIGFQAFNVLDSREYFTIAESPTYYIEQSSKRYGARFRVNVIYKFNPNDRMRQQKRRNR